MSVCRGRVSDLRWISQSPFGCCPAGEILATADRQSKYNQLNFKLKLEWIYNELNEWIKVGRRRGAADAIGTMRLPAFVQRERDNSGGRCHMAFRVPSVFLPRKWSNNAPNSSIILILIGWRHRKDKRLAVRFSARTHRAVIPSSCRASAAEHVWVSQMDCTHVSIRSSRLAGTGFSGISFRYRTVTKLNWIRIISLNIWFFFKRPTLTFCFQGFIFGFGTEKELIVILKCDYRTVLFPRDIVRSRWPGQSASLPRMSVPERIDAVQTTRSRTPLSGIIVPTIRAIHRGRRVLQTMSRWFNRYN